MKPTTLDECLDYCREAARAGNDYDTIKAEVLRWDLEPSLRKKVLLKADDYVYQYIMAKQQREKAVNRMLIGGVLLGVGLAVVFVSSFALKAEYLIPFGAIFIGGWQLKEGYKEYRQPLVLTERSNFPRGKNKFDRF